MKAIHVEQVDVAVGTKQILHKIDFHVQEGEFFGLIGPNGSGKSTLIKAIANLQQTKEGNIQVHEIPQKTFSNKELAKFISYVPQETVVGFDFNAMDVVKMGRHAYGSLFKNDTKQDEAIVRWAMEQTDTVHLMNRSIQSLSGGQRQLVMIAKALAQDTPIILLDEPISALDVYYQLKILTMLQSLCAQGKTIIIVLHDLNLASRFCHKLMILNEGKIQKLGTPEEVLTQNTLKNIYHIDAYIDRNTHMECVTVTPFL